MKNITLSADASLIEAARSQARARQTTLNEQFRIWLATYAAQPPVVEDALAQVDRMRTYVRTKGRRFTRDEMNER
jgi:hypothetical protein